MGDDNKKWEDDPSMEGFGFLQDAKGVPYDPLKTKGELNLSQGALSLEQQRRIAEAVENIQGSVSNKDFRVVTTMPDETEVLERFQDKFSSALRSEFQEALFQQWQQQQQQTIRAAGREEIARGIYDTTQDIAGGMDDLLQTADQIYKGINSVDSSISSLHDTTRGIGETADKIYDTTRGIGVDVSGIRKDLGGIGRGLGAIHHQQIRNAEFLEKINEAIDNHGCTVEGLLEDLSALAVKQIQTNMMEQKATRDAFKQEIRFAMEQICYSISHAGYGIIGALGRVGNEIADVRRAIEKLCETSTEIRNAIRRNTETNIHLVRGIRESIDRNTQVVRDGQIYSEEIKAMQYREQGRVFLEQGHPEEAIRPLKKAFKYYGTDFVTNHLLASAYERTGRREDAKRHLEIAGSMAGNKGEKASQGVAYARHEKNRGNIGSTIAKLLTAIKNNPEIYYSSQDVLQTRSVKENILDRLSNEHNNDVNILGICAMEFAAKGDRINIWKAISLLLQALSGARLSPVIYGKLMSCMHVLAPVIGQVIDTEINNIGTVGLLKIAGMLLQMNQGVETARKCVVHAYKNDPQITARKNNFDFPGIVTYLHTAMGDGVFALKKFCELPVEIRRLL